MTDAALKCCSRKENCLHPDGPWLPATSEFFGKHRTGKFGLQPKCKLCRSAEGRAYHATHREARSTYRRKHYQENRERTLAVNRQWELNNPEKRLVIAKRNRATNPEKYREKSRRWRESNLEKALEQERDRRERNRDRMNELARQRRHANPERFRENQRRYIERNPERRKEIYRNYYHRHHEERKAYGREYLRTHKQQKREYARKYKELYPERCSYLNCAAHARRNARKKSLPANFTTADWERCLNYWNHRCCICGQPAGLWHTIAQEHWIPLSDPRPGNPGTVPWNMLPMCHALKDGEGGCNNSKHNKDPLMWLTERYGPRRANEILAHIEAYFEWVQSGV